MNPFSFIFLALLLSTSSIVESKQLTQFFEEPEVVGKTRLKVLFWDVYDASLIAPKGNFSKDKPFALELKYLRDFKGKEIASRSVDEMRKLGINDEVKLAAWYQEMQDLFPDVKEGESITGIVDENRVSHFYYNNQLLGKVHDKEFSKWFFDIWLSENTSEPEMRADLLGSSR